jgi:hypothetical protein
LNQVAQQPNNHLLLPLRQPRPKLLRTHPHHGRR